MYGMEKLWNALNLQCCIHGIAIQIVLGLTEQLLLLQCLWGGYSCPLEEGMLGFVHSTGRQYVTHGLSFGSGQISTGVVLEQRAVWQMVHSLGYKIHSLGHMHTWVGGSLLVNLLGQQHSEVL